MRELYDRRLKTVKDILKRLVFSTNDRENAMNKLIFPLVEGRVLTWLTGEGYPIDSLEYNESGPLTGPGVELYRARLFIKAMTDCDLLPADPSTKFEVSVSCVLSVPLLMGAARLS